jgi:hypothetical protein
VLALLVLGLVAARALTIWVLAGGAVSAAGVWVAHTVWRVRTWRHERHYVRPLEAALTQALGVAPANVIVNRDKSNPKIVTGTMVDWPHEAEILPSDKDRVHEIVTTRLAIESPEADWNLEGRSRTVLCSQAEPPPARVALADIMPAIRASAWHEFVVGNRAPRRAHQGVGGQRQPAHRCLNGQRRRQVRAGP